MTRYYAGIGSRRTPAAVCDQLTHAASALEQQGMVLRTGGAKGADVAFFNGIESQYENCRIYIPWEGFQGFTHSDAPTFALERMPADVVAQAREIAQKHHPAWHKLTDQGVKMMTRNTFQILGETLDSPSEFVVCWTPRGAGDGGAGQAIRLAHTYEIPVIDLGALSATEAEERILSLL